MTDRQTPAQEQQKEQKQEKQQEGSGEEVIILLASSRLFLCNGFLALELIAYPTNNKYTLAMWHSSCCATFNAFKTATLAVAKTERGRRRG